MHKETLIGFSKDLFKNYLAPGASAVEVDEFEKCLFNEVLKLYKWVAEAVANSLSAVSYTHLTLPTSDLV